MISDEFTEIYFIDTRYVYKNIDYYKLHNFTYNEINKIKNLLTSQYKILSYTKYNYIEQSFIFNNNIKTIIKTDKQVQYDIFKFNYINKCINNNCLFVNKQLKRIELSQFPNIYKYDNIDIYDVAKYNLLITDVNNENVIITLYIKHNKQKKYTQVYFKSYQQYCHLIYNLLSRIVQIINFRKRLN